MAKHRLETAPLPEGRPVKTIPIPGKYPHRGMCSRHPSEYEVTAAIPTINSSARLPLVIALLRLQTVRPFIVIVDTGSTPEEYAKIQAFRAQDVEVYQIPLNGVSNFSETVSMAMDVALATCRTRFMFCCHDDVFLRSQMGLKYLRDLAAINHAAGHQITPRPHDDWASMVGHSALMLDMDWMLDHGITWNMRRGARLFGETDYRPRGDRPNWPDTETGLNYLLQQSGVMPFLTGREGNFTRNRDTLIDHSRSVAGLSINGKGTQLLKNSLDGLERAMDDGWRRVREWMLEELAEEPFLPVVAPKKKMKLPTFTMGRI